MCIILIIIKIYATAKVVDLKSNFAAMARPVAGFAPEERYP
jgi:hypothetical protein